MVAMMAPVKAPPVQTATAEGTGSKWKFRAKPELIDEVLEKVHRAWRGAGLIDTLRMPMLTREQFIAGASQAPPDVLNGESVESLWERWVVEFAKANHQAFILLYDELAFDGPTAQTDMMTVRLHCHRERDWLDGLALEKWLRGLCTCHDALSQQKLRGQVESATLLVNANLEMLQTHCSQLVTAWSKIDGNSLDQPANLVWRLLGSLPTAPKDHPVVKLRDWLAPLVQERKAEAMHPLVLLDQIFAQARFLGIDAKAITVLQRDEPKNDCDTCNNPWCQSRKTGGAKACPAMNDEMEVPAHFPGWTRNWFRAARILRAERKLESLKDVFDPRKEVPESKWRDRTEAGKDSTFPRRGAGRGGGGGRGSFQRQMTPVIEGGATGPNRVSYQEWIEEQSSRSVVAPLLSGNLGNAVTRMSALDAPEPQPLVGKALPSPRLMHSGVGDAIGRLGHASLAAPVQGNETPQSDLEARDLFTPDGGPGTRSSGNLRSCMPTPGSEAHAEVAQGGRAGGKRGEGMMKWLTRSTASSVKESGAELCARGIAQYEAEKRKLMQKGGRTGTMAVSIQLLLSTGARGARALLAWMGGCELRDLALAAAALYAVVVRTDYLRGTRSGVLALIQHGLVAVLRRARLLSVVLVANIGRIMATVSLALSAAAGRAIAPPIVAQPPPGAQPAEWWNGNILGTSNVATPLGELFEHPAEQETLRWTDALTTEMCSICGDTCTAENLRQLNCALPGQGHNPCCAAQFCDLCCAVWMRAGHCCPVCLRLVTSYRFGQPPTEVELAAACIEGAGDHIFATAHVAPRYAAVLEARALLFRRTNGELVDTLGAMARVHSPDRGDASAASSYSDPEPTCCLCGGWDDDLTLSCCATCDRWYHGGCHAPPFAQKRTAVWCCAECLGAGLEPTTCQPAESLNLGSVSVVSPIVQQAVVAPWRRRPSGAPAKTQSLSREAPPPLPASPMLPSALAQGDKAAGTPRLAHGFRGVDADLGGTVSGTCGLIPHGAGAGAFTPPGPPGELSSSDGPTHFPVDVRAMSRESPHGNAVDGQSPRTPPSAVPDGGADAERAHACKRVQDIMCQEGCPHWRDRYLVNYLVNNPSVLPSRAAASNGSLLPATPGCAGRQPSWRRDLLGGNKSEYASSSGGDTDSGSDQGLPSWLTDGRVVMAIAGAAGSRADKCGAASAAPPELLEHERLVICDEDDSSVFDTPEAIEADDANGAVLPDLMRHQASINESASPGLSQPPSRPMSPEPSQSAADEAARSLIALRRAELREIMAQEGCPCWHDRNYRLHGEACMCGFAFGDDPDVEPVVKAVYEASRRRLESDAAIARHAQVSSEAVPTELQERWAAVIKQQCEDPRLVNSPSALPSLMAASSGTQLTASEGCPPVSPSVLPSLVAASFGPQPMTPPKGWVPVSELSARVASPSPTQRFVVAGEAAVRVQADLCGARPRPQHIMVTGGAAIRSLADLREAKPTVSAGVLFGAAAASKAGCFDLGSITRHEAAALSDNGATCHCNYTTAGALGGTFQEAADDLHVADSKSSLTSKGAYLYAVEQTGANGVSVDRLFRMEHTPGSICIVLSEAVEVYEQGHKFSFDAESGRVEHLRGGGELHLHMTSNGLGWFRLAPITDADRIRALLVSHGEMSMVSPLADVDIAPLTERSVVAPTVGARRLITAAAHPPKLNGYEILVRMHHALGHPDDQALQRTLEKSHGVRAKIVTAADWAEYKRRGCAVCTLAKLKRRFFKCLPDRSKAPPGKRWFFDQIKLRVAAFEFKYLYITLFVDDHSNYLRPEGHLLHTEDQIEGACLRLRAWLRPTHGEVWIGRHDGHPAMRCLEWDEFVLDADMKDERAAEYVHEGTSKAETYIGHGVPASNAMRLCADKGEEHVYTAYLDWCRAHNYVVSKTHDPPASAAMLLYERSRDPIVSLYVWGAPCMFLIHPEIRDSKFLLHARPGWVAGWSRVNESALLVCDGVRHHNVDPGCCRIDERGVLMRSDRLSTEIQPFVPSGGEAPPAPEPTFDLWTHVATERVQEASAGAEHARDAEAVAVLRTKLGESVSWLESCMSWLEPARRRWLKNTEVSPEELEAASFPDVARWLRGVRAAAGARWADADATDDEGPVEREQPSSAQYDVQWNSAPSRPVRERHPTSFYKPPPSTGTQPAAATLPASPTDRSDDKLQRMIMPSSEYPDHTCDENGGLGWTVLVLRSSPTRNTASIKYASAVDARGRHDRNTYTVRLDQLRPMPDDRDADGCDVHGYEPFVCALDGVACTLAVGDYASPAEVIAALASDKVVTVVGLPMATPYTAAALLLDMANGDVVATVGSFIDVGREQLCLYVDPHDTKYARSWRAPRNEREYQRSPQRQLWRTARELKMDKYRALDMFDLIPLSKVPAGFRVYPTLWAGNIKFDAHDTFTKLNPRWCLQGSGMDRDMYKSFADVVRFTSIKVLACMRAAYGYVGEAHGLRVGLITLQFDVGDFFQSTRTDNDPSTPDLFCHQAPGFEEKGPGGEKLVCKVKVAMQGRIDSMHISNGNLRKILTGDVSIRQCLQDRQLYVYHHGRLVGQDVTIREILLDAAEELHDRPVELDAGGRPLSAPPGIAIWGQHVDDGVGVASSWVVAQWIAMTIEGTRPGDEPTNYTVMSSLTHWEKILGFKAEVEDFADYSTVTLSCEHLLAALAREHLADCAVLQPDHVSPCSVDSLVPGVVPAVDSPDYDAFVTMQEKCGSLIGSFIYLGQVYLQLQQLTNSLSACASSYSHGHYKAARHGLMHMLRHPRPWRAGGPGCNDLLPPGPPAERIMPHDARGRRDPALHLCVDGNLASPALPSDASKASSRSVTGIAIMLAFACVDGGSNRQHLAVADVHSSEVNAAGSGLQRACVITELLREMFVPYEDPIPCYVDSESTLLVGNNERSVKRSVWTIRRAVVLQEAVANRAIALVKIDESRNLADLFTKYLKFRRWRVHIDALLNVDPTSPRPPIEWRL